MTSIYVPGKGDIDPHLERVQEAIRAYDRRLFLARNEDTGDWCVYIHMPNGYAPYPIFGFQPEELPHLTPDAVVQRLYNADSTRHGERILDDITKNNQAVRDKYKHMADEATEDTAKRIESVLRRAGHIHTGKLYRPRSKG